MYGIQAPDYRIGPSGHILINLSRGYAVSISFLGILPGYNTKEKFFQQMERVVSLMKWERDDFYFYQEDRGTPYFISLLLKETWNPFSILRTITPCIPSRDFYHEFYPYLGEKRDLYDATVVTIRFIPGHEGDYISNYWQLDLSCYKKEFQRIGDALRRMPPPIIVENPYKKYIPLVVTLLFLLISFRLWFLFGSW